MGTSRSSTEFVKKIQDAGTAMERRHRQTVDAGALTAKKLILAEAAAKGVTPGSRIAGAKWGVRYDVKGKAGTATALVRIQGPFHLVDSPTKPHAIYRKTARARGRGSRRINREQALAEVFGGVGAYKGGALKFPDGEYRHVVQHPGTPGKGIFPAAKAKAEFAVPKVMGKSVVSGWRESFR